MDDTENQAEKRLCRDALSEAALIEHAVRKLDFPISGELDISGSDVRLEFGGGTKRSIPLPCVSGENNDDLRFLWECGQVATFGRGTKECYDERLRCAKRLLPSQFRLHGELCSLRRQVAQHIAPLADPDSLVFKPHSLNMYREGGFFTVHRDTPRDPCHIGTLVLCLPIPFTGGALGVRIPSHQGFSFDDVTDYEEEDVGAGDREVCQRWRLRRFCSKQLRRRLMNSQLGEDNYSIFAAGQDANNEDSIEYDSNDAACDKAGDWPLEYKAAFGPRFHGDCETKFSSIAGDIDHVSEESTFVRLQARVLDTRRPLEINLNDTVVEINDAIKSGYNDRPTADTNDDTVSDGDGDDVDTWLHCDWSPRSTTHLQWIAFFGDMPHEVQKVTGGLRVTLAVDLYLPKPPTSPSVPLAQSSLIPLSPSWDLTVELDACVGVVQHHLLNLLLNAATLGQTGGKVVWPCSHLYVGKQATKPGDSTQSPQLRHLKGADLAVAIALHHAFGHVAIRSMIGFEDSPEHLHGGGIKLRNGRPTEDRNRLEMQDIAVPAWQAEGTPLERGNRFMLDEGDEHE
ncbi:MAG: hypothetical protein MHM6MM_000537 [Cercozoa sp. M6MM]